MIPSLPGLLQASQPLRRCHPSGAAPRRLHPQRDGRRARLPVAGHPPRRARCLQDHPHRRDQAEQRWTAYAVSVILFSFVCILALYLQQRFQASLPLSQSGVPVGPVAPDLAYNTSRQLRHEHELAELLGRVDHDVPDPDGRARRPQLHLRGVGIAVAIALTRGLVRRSATTIGNFWVDLTRSILYILLPIAFVGRALPGLAGRDPDVRGSVDRRDDIAGRASRRSRLGPSPLRKRSRSWATTAAASSTPTRPIPSRTLRRSRTGSRCC
jgi:hypothetical protein